MAALGEAEVSLMKKELPHRFCVVLAMWLALVVLVTNCTAEMAALGTLDSTAIGTEVSLDRKEIM